MDLSIAQAVLVGIAGLVLGFAGGYATRAYKSFRRRQRLGVWPRERLT
jgi:hypothetical protein